MFRQKIVRLDKSGSLSTGKELESKSKVKNATIRVANNVELDTLATFQTNTLNAGFSISRDCANMKHGGTVNHGVVVGNFRLSGLTGHIRIRKPRKRRDALRIEFIFLERTERKNKLNISQDRHREMFLEWNTKTRKGVIVVSFFDRTNIMNFSACCSKHHQLARQNKFLLHHDERNG